MPSGENELEGVSVTSGNMNVAGLCLIFTIRTLCKVFALPVGGGFARFRFRYGGEEKSLALGHKRRAETWFTSLLVGLGDQSCEMTVNLWIMWILHCTKLYFFFGGGGPFSWEGWTCFSTNIKEACSASNFLAVLGSVTKEQLPRELTDRRWDVWSRG